MHEIEAIDAKEKRQRFLQYQIKQTKALQQEKIYVTPLAMKEKFKRLADTLRKKPNEACNALKKLFPTGLKMKWIVNKWEIGGVLAMDTKGGTSEIKIEVE